MGSDGRRNRSPGQQYDVVRRPFAVGAAAACWLAYAAAVLGADLWLAVSLTAVHGAGVMWEILHIVVVLAGFGITVAGASVAFRHGRPWARGLLTGLGSAGIATYLVLTVPGWLTASLPRNPHSAEPEVAAGDLFLQATAGLLLFTLLPLAALVLSWQRSAGLWCRTISAG